MYCRYNSWYHCHSTYLRKKEKVWHTAIYVGTLVAYRHIVFKLEKIYVKNFFYVFLMVHPLLYTWHVYIHFKRKSDQCKGLFNLREKVWWVKRFVHGQTLKPWGGWVGRGLKVFLDPHPPTPYAWNIISDDDWAYFQIWYTNWNCMFATWPLISEKVCSWTGIKARGWVGRGLKVF